MDEPENGRPNTRRFPRNKIRNLSFSLLGRCPLICPGRRAQTQQPFMYNYCQYLPSSKCNAISFIEDINRITVIWATAVKLMGTLCFIWIWMYKCAVKVEQEKENQFVFLESFAKINQTMKYSKQPPHTSKVCASCRDWIFYPNPVKDNTNKRKQTAEGVGLVVKRRTEEQQHAGVKWIILSFLLQRWVETLSKQMVQNE